MSLYSDTQLARTGLVSLWRLNETSGTSAADSKGTNTGTYTGGFTLNRTGLLVPQFDYDPSVKFDGATGAVAVPDAASLRAAQFSVEAIIDPVAGAPSTSYATIAEKYTLSNDGWFLGLYNGQQLEAFLGSSGFGGGTVPLNATSHVALTYDGTTANLWLNGTVVASLTVGFTANTAALNLAIWGTSFPFNGYIQEASYYSRALTANEVKTDAAIAALAFSPMYFERTVALDAGIARRPTPVNNADYALKPTDSLILVSGLTAGRTMTLPTPSALVKGQDFTVKDMGGNAATNNITVASAALIDGAASKAINTNYGAMRVICDGTTYGVI